MKLYLLSQDKNNGYDTFDACIVCAENEDEARKIPPSTLYPEFGWCEPEYVNVEYIGEALSHIKKGLVLASFNAG